MKKVKYPNLNDYDLSAYEELKGDILYRINGGTEIENSNDAVANAKVGDTLTRSNGEVVEITEEHIQWARDHGGKVLEGMDDGTPNSGDDGGSCVEPTESEKPAPSVENGSNTKNSSNNAGILSSNNNLKIPTTSNASSIQVASGANSAGRTNVNAGSNAAGTGSQAAVNSSRPSGVPGGVKGNTVTGKPIAGCVIEHTDDNQNIIRVSWNDKMALKEAEDKFLAYTNGGFDCRLEVYTANGSARVFNRFADFYDEVHPNKPSTILYENEFLKIEAGKVSGGYNLKDSTPWEIEASALELSTSTSWENFEVNTSYQALNLEGNISFSSIKDPGFSVSAKASALDLEGEVSFKAFDYTISITPGISIGSIGGEMSVGPNGFKAGVALCVGGGIGVNWSKE